MIPGRLRRPKADFSLVLTGRSGRGNLALALGLTLLGALGYSPGPSALWKDPEAALLLGAAIFLNVTAGLPELAAPARLRRHEGPLCHHAG